MTPEEKANELYSKYDDLLNKDFGNPIVFDNQIKQCALIAVEFAMNSPYSFKPMDGGWISGKMYYEEVKKEIENL